MAKIFWDHLVILEEVEKQINQLFDSHQEKIEIWEIVDNIAHHRILHCILKFLPETHHIKFLNMFHKAPHNNQLLIFLNEKSETDIETELQNEAKSLTLELLELLQS